jgi:hypothetical protein
LCGGLLAGSIVAAATTCAAQTSVLTQHNDNSRTGLNPNETILTTSNVNVNQFGKLFSLPVDGQVYAQPLYVPNVTFPGNVIHNVLIVATENDSVYAFDADSNKGANAAPLWKASLIDQQHGAAAGETPINNSAVITGCNAISPQIGITGTPVIDMATPPTPTIYVLAKSINGSIYTDRLHALDITTGNEKPQGPVAITATVTGTGDLSANGTLSFDPQYQFNRAALLLLNGNVYIPYASVCYGTFHGWIFSYDESSFAPKSSFATTPNGLRGGIWLSGGGMAADSNGYVYAVTGDGTFDTTVPIADFGDSILKLSTNSAEGKGYLVLSDYFTPYDQANLLTNDIDLGAGAALLLPDQQSGTHPHLLVQAGKEGRIYLVDRDQLTSNPSSPGQPEHYCSGCTSDPQVVQESPTDIGGIWGMPAFWNNNVYFWGNKDVLKSIPLSGGLLDYTHVTAGTLTSGYPPPIPTVSSDGTLAGTAILWAIDASAAGAAGPAVLYAYDASNLSNLLWTSSQASNSRDRAGNAVKFATPTIVNGKVYIGASSEVDVYGLLPATTVPNAVLTITKTHTGSFTQGEQGASYTVTVSNAANASSTSGTVTVTETLPSGLSLASMAGSGWSCTANVCTRGDVLSAGAAYPPITVIVDVASDANSPQQNEVSVSGGGASGASASDWTPIAIAASSAAVVLPTSGTPQTATVNTPFVMPLEATVTDSLGELISGAMVTFTAPASGTRGTFPGIANAATATTNAQGVATSPSFTANNTTGSYVVNATVSGVSSPASFSLTNVNSSATFIGSDQTTEGNWIGVYGQDGYSLANSTLSLPGNVPPQRLPAYVQAFSPENELTYIWASPTWDSRGLETDTYGDRTAQTWYNIPSFSLDLNITGGAPQRVAFYAVDFSMKSRVETIQIVDASTNAVLDQESISNFVNGIYLIWTISGHVTINVICDGGENAVVSGLFFGGTSSASPVGARINPQAVNLTSNQAQQFTAAVIGATNQSVTWSYTPTVGTLTPSGLYVAPEAIAPQTLFVTATSVANPSVSATAIVNLTGGATATFVGSDTTTQGNWRGVWGSDGYVVAADSQALPVYASFSAQNESSSVWNSNTTDPRALETGNGQGRIAASWFSNSPFSFSVNFADAKPHELALYALDWDNQGRAETIQIVDAATGTQLDTRSLSNFSNGVYLIWNVSGNIKINITSAGGPNGVLSGFFFGGASESVIVNPQSVSLTAGQTAQFGATVSGTANQSVAWAITSVTPAGAAPGSFSTTTAGLYQAPGTLAAAETITVTATTADGLGSGSATVNLGPSGTTSTSATYMGTNTTTEGNWQSLYGADGYALASVTQSLPSYATLTFQSATVWVWNPSTTDPRALKLPGGSGATAATWYNNPSFSLNVNVGSGTHQLALYAIDWDNNGRAETIQIVDAATGAQLDLRTLSNFTNGVYLIWNVSGNIQVNVTRTGGSNAVISGVFF